MYEIFSFYYKLNVDMFFLLNLILDIYSIRITFFFSLFSLTLQLLTIAIIKAVY